MYIYVCMQCTNIRTTKRKRTTRRCETPIDEDRFDLFCRSIHLLVYVFNAIKKKRDII